MPQVIQRHLEFYEDAQGRQPFRRWLDALDDITQARIRHRLTRLELGNMGDCKAVGGGVHELRCFFGSGYRLYFAEAGANEIVLLLGGDKQIQPRDIRTAQSYWVTYKSKRQS